MWGFFVSVDTIRASGAETFTPGPANASRGRSPNNLPKGRQQRIANGLNNQKHLRWKHHRKHVRFSSVFQCQMEISRTLSKRAESKGDVGSEGIEEKKERETEQRTSQATLKATPQQ
ncbi:hypothetical protein TWF225_000566 [Orbilia oligospora]|nr:hypothetical protein TWF225_000566 [Orbilia oligospora]KAF3264634.1 hypothetical protein TWF128_001096 [Orbilia oligospora]